MALPNYLTREQLAVFLGITEERCARRLERYSMVARKDGFIGKDAAIRMLVTLGDERLHASPARHVVKLHHHVSHALNTVALAFGRQTDQLHAASVAMRERYIDAERRDPDARCAARLPDTLDLLRRVLADYGLEDDVLQTVARVAVFTAVDSSTTYNPQSEISARRVVDAAEQAVPA